MKKEKIDRNHEMRNDVPQFGVNKQIVKMVNDRKYRRFGIE